MDPLVVSSAEGAPRLIYDSPHSGRFYPPDFATKAARNELRRGEDAYVDRLLAGAPPLGATVLAATYPRCYIDVNRGERDIDQAMLAEPWPTPLEPTEKSTRGLGLIRRFVVPGIEVPAGPLSVADVQQRIDRVYRPYHRRLDSLIGDARRAHRMVWHLDWHSMKSKGNAMTPDGPGATRPDFVVSDVWGRSAAAQVTALVVDALTSFGYRVAVNDPYTGGSIVQRIGSPSSGVHSIQIEINRALYLDETAVALSAGFSKLRNDIDTLTRRLVVAASHSA